MCITLCESQSVLRAWVRKVSADAHAISRRIATTHMTPKERNRAYLGSFAALLLTAGPLLVYVLAAGALGVSAGLQVAMFFLLLGVATKAYLVLSERFTRPSSDTGE